MYEQFLSLNGELRAVTSGKALAMERIGEGEGNNIELTYTVLGVTQKKVIPIDPKKDFYKQVSNYQKDYKAVELSYEGSRYRILTDQLFDKDQLRKDVLLLGQVNALRLKVKDEQGATRYLEFAVFNNIVVYRLDNSPWTRYDPENLKLSQYTIEAKDGYVFNLNQILRVLNLKRAGKNNNIFYDQIRLDSTRINRSLDELGIEIITYKFQKPTSLYSIPSQYSEKQNLQKAQSQWVTSEKQQPRTESKQQTSSHQDKVKTNQQNNKAQYNGIILELYNKLNNVDRDNVAGVIQDLLNGKYSWIWFRVAKKDVDTIKAWFDKYFKEKYQLTFKDVDNQRVEIRVDPVKQQKPGQNNQVASRTDTKTQYSENLQKVQSQWIVSEKQQPSETQDPRSQQTLSEKQQPRTDAKQDSPVLDQLEKITKKEDSSNKSPNTERDELEQVTGITIPSPLTYDQIRVFSDIYSQKLKTRETGQYLSLAERLLSERSEMQIYIMLGLNPDQMIGNKQLMQKTYQLTGARPMSDAEYLAIVLDAVAATHNLRPQSSEPQNPRSQWIVSEKQQPSEPQNPRSTVAVDKKIEKPLDLSPIDKNRKEVQYEPWFREVLDLIRLNPENIDGATIREPLNKYYSDEEIELLKSVYEREFKDKMSWESFKGLAIYYFQKPVEEVR